ncbi:MAG: type II toxin-antitoxin system RelE/ParE family toxin [Dehalococcoidales bacterium]|nr:type II toxin-antitoxin system RelE/ParE family toxin [Dehalococcoidales bacterium]
MIKGFKDKEAERLFNREPTRKLAPEIQRAGLRKLRMLHRARTLDDLKVPPGNRLESLKGDRQGQYSIRINDRWRICFIWELGDVYKVEIVDYH